jgi:mRNA interferase MazF
MDIRRGDIFVAALDPVVGREMSKTRPVLIVSNDQNNRFSATVTILPITSGSLDKVYPFEILLPAGTGNLPKDSKVKADQIRTLDKTRLLKRIGSLGDGEMRLAEKAMGIHLAMSLDPACYQD